jgi:hypothetical protein
VAMDALKRGRLILSGAGSAIAAAAWPLQSREALAIALFTLGLAVFVLGVILPRVESFSLGLKGIHASLNRIERAVNALVQPDTTEAKTHVFGADDPADN